MTPVDIKIDAAGVGCVLGTAERSLRIADVCPKRRLENVGRALSARAARIHALNTNKDDIVDRTIHTIKKSCIERPSPLHFVTSTSMTNVATKQGICLYSRLPATLRLTLGWIQNTTTQMPARCGLQNSTNMNFVFTPAIQLSDYLTTLTPHFIRRFRVPKSHA